MTITWYGNNCIGVASRASGSEKVALFFPHDKTSRARLLEEKADVVCEDGAVLAARAISAKEIEGNGFLIEHPGEYERGGFVISGIAALEEEGSYHTIYAVRGEGLSLAHLGFMQKTALSDSELEALGNIDILVIPVGGGEGALAPQTAAAIIQQIEPRTVIPVAFRTERSSKDRAPLEKFLKEFGSEKLSPLPKFSLKEKDLPQEETQVVALEAQ